MAWSRIASASGDKTIIIWDAETGEQKTQLTGHTRGVNSVSWSPEGSKIASGSYDGTVIIWDAVTGEQKTQLKGHTRNVKTVAWSPEGSKIASGSSDDTIIIWDAVTGEQKSQLKGHTFSVFSVAWNPEGSKIVSGGGDDHGSRPQIIVWDAVSGDKLSELVGHPNAVRSVAWSPEGSKLASADGHPYISSVPGTIIIWDAETGKKSLLKGHAWSVNSVVWSPGGSKIASASDDWTIIIWDAWTGEQRTQLKGHAGGVTSVAWSPEGFKIASGSDDKTVIIWDVLSGKQASKSMGHHEAVYSVTWSDGESNVVSGSGDRSVIVTNSITGDQISQLKGHSGAVSSVACTPTNASDKPQPGGGALIEAEIQKMKTAALTGKAVSATATRFFEDPYELKIGRAADAARGLVDRMQVIKSEYHRRVGDELVGIQNEVREFASKFVDGKEVSELLHYIVHEKSSEKEYPNGIRDKGRKGVRLAHFLTHNNAQKGGLSEAEVVALRLYTTSAYKFMNNPLRDNKRYSEGQACPLPVTTHFAAEGIRKLRGLYAPDDQSEQALILWRGMRNTKVTDMFMKQGGTELAFMSTTTDLDVAVRYSLSQHSLILKIVPSNFMSFGADLQWLSAFPEEAEMLYPPLMYLRPTGKTDEISVARDGHKISIMVVEVVPSY